MRIAGAWFARLSSSSPGNMPREETLPVRPLAALAAFAAIALTEARTLLILVPDDDLLPELSNSLDLAIRPLCLVLPAADFAARIALRATLSLLNSRLWCDGEEGQSAVWERQRERIAANASLWQEVQTWAAKNDRSDGPVAVAELFPVRILPLAAYRRLQHQASDITLLYRCNAPPELIAPAGHVLRIGPRAAAPRHRSLALADEDARLVLEWAQLTRDIADLELELITVQAEVAEFMRHYYERVGRRMAELDALQAQRAREEAERAPDNRQAWTTAKRKQQQAEQSAHESQRFTEAATEEAPVFRPTQDIKRLFRQIAQQIHPDRAIDEADRAWRTQLMSEANRAYRHGDERALREVAALWDEGRGGMPGTAASPSTFTAPAPGPTLLRQVERLRARLSEIESELHRLFGSHLYELFIATRQARRQGRDLLGEMGGQIDASIAQLQRDYRTDAAWAGSMPYP
ncbi:MAG: J domain-containing protein [Rhodocyclales bacterium]|nr:J domain-containing protein [Rhodocyclales bacterium]